MLINASSDNTKTAQHLDIQSANYTVLWFEPKRAFKMMLESITFAHSENYMKWAGSGAIMLL